MEQNNEPEALDVANQLEKGFITLGKTARALRYEAAETIRRLHARNQELEAFVKEIEQYGVLLRAGGAAPHDLEDLSAALAQCVELAQGVLK